MLVLFFFVLGLIVGSYLNVLVLRFGYRESASKRSHCAQCGTTLSVFDLVPLLSFIWLSGRCRSCKSKISWQYPAVELVTGLLFALAASQLGEVENVYVQAAFVASLGFWATVVATVAYDIRHTLIPLPFIYVLYGFSIAYAILFALGSAPVVLLIDALLGAFICGGFFALLHVLTRGRGMGIGDAYVAGAVGLYFGVDAALVIIALSVWSGALIGLIGVGLVKVFPQVRLEVAQLRVTLLSEIPFAPFLALGAIGVATLPILVQWFGVSGLGTWFAHSLLWNFWW